MGENEQAAALLFVQDFFSASTIFGNLRLHKLHAQLFQLHPWDVHIPKQQNKGVTVRKLVTPLFRLNLITKVKERYMKY